MKSGDKEIQRNKRSHPVVLSEYSPEWPKIYSAEEELITNAIGSGTIARISHIGSTSVEGMTAKPVIDILLEIGEDFNKDGIIGKMEGLGYRYDYKPQNPAPHMMFKKGYGNRDAGVPPLACHVHVRFEGDWDELYFNKYLSMHPETAKEYIALKRRLKERYEFDRAAYTDGKTEFIMNAVKKARKEQG